MEPISCGKEHSVWRYTGDNVALKGCVARIPRRIHVGERPSSGLRWLQELLGTQYVHLPLHEISLDIDTATYLFGVALSTCASGASPTSDRAASAIQRLIIATEQQVSASPRELARADNLGAAVVATIELDHTQLRASSSTGTDDGTLSICVELKPKCGVLPGEPLSSLRPVQCRHCLYVRHKERRDGLARTAFCPLDLFSADAARLHRALHALLQVPHNNMRVFRRTGVPCFGALHGNAKSDLHAELALEFGRCDADLDVGCIDGPAVIAPATGVILTGTVAHATVAEANTSCPTAASVVTRPGVLSESRGEWASDSLEEELVEVLGAILLQEPLLQRLHAVQASAIRTRALTQHRRAVVCVQVQDCAGSGQGSRQESKQQPQHPHQHPHAH